MNQPQNRAAGKRSHFASRNDSIRGCGYPLVERDFPRALVGADRRGARLALRRHGSAAVRPGADAGPPGPVARVGSRSVAHFRRLGHGAVHRRLGDRRPFVRIAWRPLGPGPHDDPDDPALLSVHRAFRPGALLARICGLSLSVWDGHRRRVRGGRGARGRDHAGACQAVRARPGPGVLLGRGDHRIGTEPAGRAPDDFRPDGGMESALLVWRDPQPAGRADQAARA